MHCVGSSIILVLVSWNPRKMHQVFQLQSFTLSVRVKQSRERWTTEVFKGKEVSTWKDGRKEYELLHSCIG